jgi:hypothetical protein
MNTKQLFKTAFLLVMVLLVINFTSNAEALELFQNTGFVKPTGPACQLVTGSDPNPCIGEYSLDDMGQFNGEVWVWNQEFIATVDPYFQMVPVPGPNWQNDLKPTKVVLPPRVTSGRLEHRVFADGRAPDIRLTFKASTGGEEIKYPQLTLSECIKPVSGSPTGFGPCECSDPMSVRATIMNFPEPPPNCQAGPQMMGSCQCAQEYPTLAEIYPIQPSPPMPNSCMINIEGEMKSGFWDPFGPHKEQIASADINPCCKAWTQLHRVTKGVPGSVITMDQIKSVKWVEKSTPTPDSPCTTNPGCGTPYSNYAQFTMSSNYNMDKGFWNPLPGNWSYGVDMMYTWAVPSNLTEGEGATFQITLKDFENPGTVLVPVKTIIESIDIMPAIPATVENSITVGSGRDSKKKTVTANNIIVREVLDPTDPLAKKALVIQWPEPDAALFSGADMTAANSFFQCMVVIGANVSPNPVLAKDVYVMLFVPVQMGVAVLDAPSYDALKAKMLLEGFTLNDISALIMYRQVYSFPGTTTLQYQNRGQSPKVPINTF